MVNSCLEIRNKSIITKYYFWIIIILWLLLSNLYYHHLRIYTTDTRTHTHAYNMCIYEVDKCSRTMVLHNNKIVVLSDWPINVTLFRDVTIGQLVCVCDLHSTTLLIYIRNIHTNEAFNHLPICIGIYFSTHYTHTHTDQLFSFRISMFSFRLV